MHIPNTIPEGIHHDGSSLFVSSLNPQIGDTVTIRLRMPSTYTPDRLGLRTAPDGEQEIVPMHKAYDDKVSSWWEGAIKVQERVNNYRFFILHEGARFWYNAGGMTGASPTDALDFRIIAGDLHPDWVDSSVFYQIFPDRFCRGKSSPGDEAYEYDGHTRIMKEWGEAPLSYQQAGNMDFFGGNLNGILEKVDYLADLGVNALHLNPIFTSPSNHKYDCVDFFSIDPTLGGDGAFESLMKTLHERGIKVILDIAPNHCGILHPWFQEAMKDLEAPSADFFTFYTHPHEYEMWKGVKTMPKLNYTSRRLRGLLYQDSDSAVRKWMKAPYRVDGWRIDVANMLARQGETQLGHEVVRELRSVIKEEYAQAYLLGEHFFDGTSHLQGDELDASMNFQGFSFPFWNWLAPQELWWIDAFKDVRINRISTESLISTWVNFMAPLPWATVRRQFNLLGNHDTPRILHHLEGNRRLTMTATAVLFAFPGVPSIYYGDEIGLSGRRDPGCRECMPWKSESWNMELRQFYQKLIALRRNSPALSGGSFEVLHMEEDLFAFKREVIEEAILLIANRSPVSRKGLALKAGLHGLGKNRIFKDLFGDTTYRIEEGILTVPSIPGESFLMLGSAF